MTNPTQLIDRYIAVWNETDPARRRALIERTWHEDASYLDPLLQGDGHAGIDAMVQAVHERYPQHRFERIGEVDVHHDRLRFAWAFNAPDGSVYVRGSDYARLAPDERLREVTGFFEPAA